MNLFFLKCLISFFSLCGVAANENHPIYVSVLEVEHNASKKTLEVSCKIFTDDFEKTLRSAYNTRVDLLDTSSKKAMDKLVNDYVQKHVKINCDGKNIPLKYLGFENIEEGIYSYFEAYKVDGVKQITVVDDILFEYKKEQISLLHITVGGKRQSTKLVNPEKMATLYF